MKIIALVLVLACVGAVPASFGDSHPADIGELIKYLFENRRTPILDELCQNSEAHIVYLNHTIVNGTINGICSDWAYDVYISLEAEDDGYFTIDIPKDIFDNELWYGDDRGFGIDVYSSKYVTWDEAYMVDRYYIPTNFTYNIIGEWGWGNCDSDFTHEECFAWATQKRFNEKHKDVRPLIVTKIKSTDTFDRYKFPFLKDDLLFMMTPILTGVEREIPPYNPEKYTTPMPGNTAGTPEKHTWQGVDELLKNMFENRRTPTLDYVCQSPLAETVYLNHTIVNGTINGTCSDGPYGFHISLDADDDGYFTIDIPKDVFDNEFWHKCDQGFGIDAYSSKYVTYDMRHMVYRNYIPTNMTDYCTVDASRLACDPTYTDEGCLEWQTRDRVEDIHEDARPLVITKVKSTDTFDRYKFPFLKDDLFFSMRPVLNGSPHSFQPYSPEKYTVPMPGSAYGTPGSQGADNLVHDNPAKYNVPGNASDIPDSQGAVLRVENPVEGTNNTSGTPDSQGAGNPIPDSQDADSQDADYCDSEFVPIMKPGGAIACVTPPTFEKLIQRGWSEANP